MTILPPNKYAQSTTDKYRPDIQGLRALAIISVFLFHINKKLLPGGFLGVDLFFVISGFIVTSIISNRLQKTSFSLKYFYLNRIKRIVPAYAVMLAITTCAMSILLIPSDFVFFKESLLHALIFKSNHYFSIFGDYFAPKAYELPLLHTWSLSVEMQFYLIFPLFFYFAPTKYIKFILTMLLLGCLLLWLLRQENPENYFSLYLRIPEFILGSLTLLYQNKVAFINKSNWLSFLGIFLILIGLSFLNENIVYPNPLILIPCLGCSLIILTSKSKINEYIGNPILTWIGNLSYSIYLWHWPILVGAKYYYSQYELSLLTTLVLIVLILTISCFSYYCIEVPFRKRDGVTKTIYIYKVHITLSIILLLLISPYLNSNLIAPLPIEQTRYASADKICHGKIINNCDRGALFSKKQILVLGDSHAAQLNYFFDVVGSRNNFMAKIISGSSCITIPNFDVNRLPLYAQNSCVKQIKAASKYAKNFDKILLAGMWEYHVTSQEFVKALDDYLTENDKSGKSVIILAQIPMFDSNVSRIYRFQQLGLNVPAVLSDDWKKANNIIQRIASRHSSAQFINLTKSYFFEDIPFDEHGTLIYFDNNHLNEVGSREYGLAVSKYLSKFI